MGSAAGGSRAGGSGGARVLVEVCVDSPAGAVAAAAGGGDRVELCSALIVGGLTPSIGTLAETLAAAAGMDVQVLIRPREGDFVYDHAEVRAMLRDIAAVRREAESASVTVGFVIGALDADGAVDTAVTAELVAAAAGAPVTFHRAFDLLADLDAGLDTLMALGVDRILTGGGVQRAVDGLPQLAALVQRAGTGLVVMPGGSIRPANAAAIVAATGAREIHFRAPVARANHAAPRSATVRMSSAHPPDETAREDTDVALVAATVAALR